MHRMQSVIRLVQMVGRQNYVQGLSVIFLSVGLLFCVSFHFYIFLQKIKKNIYFTVMLPKVNFNPSVTLFKFQPTALDGGRFYLIVSRNIFTPCGVPKPGLKGFCRPIGIKMKFRRQLSIVELCP